MRHGLRRYAARLVTVCGTAGDRLATSRLANIFGNGTMYRHDKKFEKGKNPRNKPNIRNKPSAPEPGEIVRRTLRKSRLATVCGTVGDGMRHGWRRYAARLASVCSAVGDSMRHGWRRYAARSATVWDR